MIPWIIWRHRRTARRGRLHCLASEDGLGRAFRKYGRGRERGSRRSSPRPAFGRSGARRTRATTGALALVRERCLPEDGSAMTPAPHHRLRLLPIRRVLRVAAAWRSWFRRNHRRAGCDGCVLLPQGGRTGAPLRNASRRAGLQRAASWWPIPLLALSGLVVALTIRTCRGREGTSRRRVQGIRARAADRVPRDRHCSVRHAQPRGRPRPEAPLIAIGSGLGVLAVHLLRRDAPRVASVDRRRRELPRSARSSARRFRPRS